MVFLQGHLSHDITFLGTKLINQDMSYLVLIEMPRTVSTVSKTFVLLLISLITVSKRNYSKFSDLSQLTTVKAVDITCFIPAALDSLSTVPTGLL